MLSLIGRTKVLFEEDISKNNEKLSAIVSNSSFLVLFDQRIKKNQLIVAQMDIKRYFITSQKSGKLCLIITKH